MRKCLSSFETVGDAAASARVAAFQLYRLLCSQRRAFWYGVPTVAVILSVLSYMGFQETYRNPRGHAFHWISGVSIWPAQLLRVIGSLLTVVFIFRSHAVVQAGICHITRKYRLPYLDCEFSKCDFRLVVSAAPVPRAALAVVDPWRRYQQLNGWSQRFVRSLFPLILYALLTCGIALIEYFWAGGSPYHPARGTLIFVLEYAIFFIAAVLFLFLSFWVLDAVRLCRWLIEQISEAHTIYPEPCLDHFASCHNWAGQREALANWIDIQLIADLTEVVGRLVYYPFIIFFVIVISRNSFCAHWPWPWSIILILILNFSIIVGSVVVLDLAARKARRISIARLEENVEKRKLPAKERKADVAAELLEDARNLKKGAFVPFWQKPLVRAILLPSGGGALIELFTRFFAN
jgi:hypothetical protein